MKCGACSVRIEKRMDRHLVGAGDARKNRTLGRVATTAPDDEIEGRLMDKKCEARLCLSRCEKAQSAVGTGTTTTLKSYSDMGRRRKNGMKVAYDWKRLVSNSVN